MLRVLDQSFLPPSLGGWSTCVCCASSTTRTFGGPGSTRTIGETVSGRGRAWPKRNGHLADLPFLFLQTSPSGQAEFRPRCRLKSSIFASAGTRRATSSSDQRAKTCEQLMRNGRRSCFGICRLSLPSPSSDCRGSFASPLPSSTPSATRAPSRSLPNDATMGRMLRSAAGAMAKLGKIEEFSVCLADKLDWMDTVLAAHSPFLHWPLAWS